MMVRPTAFLRIAKILLVFGIIDACVSIVWFFHVIHAPLPHQDRKYDALVTLMGDFNPQLSGLGEDTKRRLNHTVSLFRQNKATYFVCVGGLRPKSHVVGAELMRDYLKEHGIPPQRIIASGTSFDTRSNWRDVSIIIREHGWREVGLVSSPLHLFRFNNAFSDQNVEVALSLLPFSYKDTQPRAGIIKIWQAIHYEWCAYLLYQLPMPVYRCIISQLRPQ